MNPTREIIAQIKIIEKEQNKLVREITTLRCHGEILVGYLYRLRDGRSSDGPYLEKLQKAIKEFSQ